MGGCWRSVGTNLHNGRTSECPSHVQDHRSYIVMTQSLTLAGGPVQERGAGRSGEIHCRRG